MIEAGRVAPPEGHMEFTVSFLELTLERPGKVGLKTTHRFDEGSGYKRKLQESRGLGRQVRARPSFQAKS